MNCRSTVNAIDPQLVAPYSGCNGVWEARRDRRYAVSGLDCTVRRIVAEQSPGAQASLS